MITIAYDLPRGANGGTAIHHSYRIRAAVSEWARTQRRPVEAETVQYRVYVEFYREEDLTLFLLTDPLSSYKFTRVEGIPD
jgi:hypothetical protein